MLKSVCRVLFVTYRGAFTKALRILDWDLCMVTVGLAGATPQFYSVALIGVIIALQMSDLFSIDRWDFFPISQLIPF